MELTSHPLALLAPLWLGVWVVVRSANWHRFPGLRAGVWAAVALQLTFMSIAVWYLWRAAYFDPAEPTITAISALIGHGHPLYPAIDASERFVHVYGPGLFLIHAAAFALAGSSVFVSKAVGAVAIALSLVFTQRAVIRQAGGGPGFVAGATLTAIYLMFGNVTFWTRAEPLLIMCLAAGLWLVHLRRPVAVIGLGMATGLALSLKISAPAYVLPLFVLLFFKQRLTGALGAAAIALVVALLPFVNREISLANYIEYLQLSAGNGLLGAKLRQNAEWLLFFAAPVGAAVISGRRLGAPAVRADMAVLAAAALGSVAIAIIGAKPGGGPYHFLPFAPVWVWLALSRPAGAWQVSWARAGGVAFILVAVILAVPRQFTLYRTIDSRPLEPAIEDVRRFAAAHPASRIAVGYAGTSRWSDARVEIVFLQRDYLLDAPAVQEHRLSGLDLPPATYQAMDTCRAEYWLIPTGAEPFSVPSAYTPLGPPDVFPEAFRRAFQQRYVLTSRTAFFDVWRCR